MSKMVNFMLFYFASVETKCLVLNESVLCPKGVLWKEQKKTSSKKELRPLLSYGKAHLKTLLHIHTWKA